MVDGDIYSIIYCHLLFNLSLCQHLLVIFLWLTVRLNVDAWRKPC